LKPGDKQSNQLSEFSDNGKQEVPTVPTSSHTKPNEPIENKKRIIRNFGKLIALLANYFHVRFFLGLFFGHEDGGDMFLQNVS
jgi:hypothetical protein